MKTVRLFLFYLSAAMLLSSCGGRPHGSFFKNVKELRLPFSTQEQRDAAEGAEIDTAMVRKLELAPLIDLPESWTIVGKITRENWTALVYHHTSASESDYYLTIYTLDGKNTVKFELEINRPPSGEMVPQWSEIPNDSTILTRYILKIGDKSLLMERAYRMTADGHVLRVSEANLEQAADTQEESTGNSALRKAELPLELTEKNFAIGDKLTQQGVGEIHGKDENEEYREIWTVKMMNMQKDLVDEAMPHEGIRYVYGVIDLYREPAYTATLFRYTNQNSGHVLYYVTTLSTAEGKVISRQKLLDPLFFATGEGADYQPVVKIRFEADKQFSIYLKSDVETREESYRIDDSGVIHKN